MIEKGLIELGAMYRGTNRLGFILNVRIIDLEEGMVLIRKQRGDEEWLRIKDFCYWANEKVEES